jgi:phosphoglycerate dehydrogenase-like enzyme
MTARRIARSLRALWRRLEERLGEADFIIVTTPETPDTSGMFNARLFSRMKRGAYFINIARGRCVVTQDLVAALQSGQLAGAGLDVVDPEPLPPDSPLWGMPNVLITPHDAILGTPLSPEMGSDPPRKLPALCRGSAAAQRRRQGKMVLTARVGPAPGADAHPLKSRRRKPRCAPPTDQNGGRPGSP